MDLMKINQIKGNKFSIEVRNHKINLDMHKDDGGEDTGMNPIELMVGALGACIGMTINIYCAMKKIPSEGIAVNAVPTLASDPKRIKNITIDITLPDGFPEERKEAILRVAHKCPVYNTLKDLPEIDIDIA